MKVNSGQHEGQTGMVVRVEDPICVLVSDSTHEELQVFARDLTESSEAATGLDRYVSAACALRPTPGVCDLAESTLHAPEFMTGGAALKGSKANPSEYIPFLSPAEVLVGLRAG